MAEDSQKLMAEDSGGAIGGDSGKSKGPSAQEATYLFSEEDETDYCPFSTEIFCKMATFMSPGETLSALCIAVGPTEARHIRRVYLLGNDKYVEHALFKVNRALPAITTSTLGRIRWKEFRTDMIVHLDKCRDNILAWMEINENWRARCTPENLEHYKSFKLPPPEANVVFNNVVVSLEIGLLDVFRFLVEEKHINVNRNDWFGFYSAYSPMANMQCPLYEVAMIRGDVALLEYFLSIDTLDLTRTIYLPSGDISDQSTKVFEMVKSAPKECFQCLLRHPKTNLNHFDSGNGEDALNPLRWLLYVLHHSLFFEDRQASESCTDGVIALIDNGADPYLEHRLARETAYQVATEELGLHPSDPYFKRIVEKMESVPRED